MYTRAFLRAITRPPLQGDPTGHRPNLCLHVSNHTTSAKQRTRQRGPLVPQVTPGRMLTPTDNPHRPMGG